MTVSRENSKLLYQGIKDAGIRFITALPETWLVYLLQMAESDPEMCRIEVAREEEAIGVAAIAAPLKIVGGSGSPVRVLALAPR
jgi:sulfopyruvate decarboxylase subunit alpha